MRTHDVRTWEWNEWKLINREILCRLLYMCDRELLWLWWMETNLWLFFYIYTTSPRFNVARIQWLYFVEKNHTDDCKNDSFVLQNIHWLAGWLAGWLAQIQWAKNENGNENNEKKKSKQKKRETNWQQTAVNGMNEAARHLHTSPNYLLL